MSAWKSHFAGLLHLVQRFPRMVALFGFVSGAASFLLVDRQEKFAGVIAVVMLVSWLWLILENTLTRGLAQRFGWELPPPLLRYATQLIHQESLFFILPFFLITTTWNSGQAVFTALLAAAALVAIVDPVYYKWLAPRQWVFLAYHTLTLFGVLLTALPMLFQLTTPEAYKLALGTAVLLSFPSLARTLPLEHWWRWLLLIALCASLGGLGWLVRPWVPPATLWLTEVAVTTQFDNQLRIPGASVDQVTATQLHRQGLYAYTAINAPRGLQERIYHRWLHDGKQVDRIALNIKGGRKAGYRAWTHKRNFPNDSVGHWQVQVLTEAGQMIGTLRFRVVD